MIYDGSCYFYHFDQTGNTVAVTDSSGNVANAYAYEPYGAVTASTENVPNPFTFVGAHGVMDEGNGLYYMKSRHYDSAISTFIQKDPIGFSGGTTNLYSYVANNPVGNSDPDGDCFFGVDCLVLGAGILAGVAVAGAIHYMAEQFSEQAQQADQSISDMKNAANNGNRLLPNGKDAVANNQNTFCTLQETTAQNGGKAIWEANTQVLGAVTPGGEEILDTLEVGSKVEQKVGGALIDKGKDYITDPSTYQNNASDTANLSQ
jgi:RHS repeat-associated protein